MNDMDKRREVLPSFFYIFYLFYEESSLNLSLKIKSTLSRIRIKFKWKVSLMWQRVYAKTLQVMMLVLLQKIILNLLGNKSLCYRNKKGIYSKKWADILRLSFAGRSLFTEF